MPLTGDIQYTTGFNANGIAARGGWLVLVQSNTGLLFRVNPRTGATRQIDTGGYSVTFGDGLEFRRPHAVRRPQPDQHGRRAAVVAAPHARPPGRRDHCRPWRLSVPTTATVSRGALWVVNARFGTPPTPTTDYWITRLPLRP